MGTDQLIWHLRGIIYKEKAVNFLKRFEDALCVFSGAVSQIYANYNIWPITADNSKLLVLPNPNAHHDIFQAIEGDAVVKTGLFILPGEAVGKQGLYLGQKNKKSGRLDFVPLDKGLRKVAEQMPEDEPFLPVITNKDLRELDSKNPILHLHRLKAQKLNQVSTFEAGTIRKTIEGKMNKYLMCA